MWRNRNLEMSKVAGCPVGIEEAAESTATIPEQALKENEEIITEEKAVEKADLKITKFIH